MKKDWFKNNYSEHTKDDLIDKIIQQAERVEELEEDNKTLEDVNKANYWAGNEIKFENQRYKQALEYTQSELEYAHVTGNMNLRNDLIKKSLKAIDKALAGDKDD